MPKLNDRHGEACIDECKLRISFTSSASILVVSPRTQVVKQLRTAVGFEC